MMLLALRTSPDISELQSGWELVAFDAGPCRPGHGHGKEKHGR